MTRGFPRFFRFGRHWINSYKVLLCVGLYVGVLATAGAAERAGYSPLRAGLAAMTAAIAGFVGARGYHLVVQALVHRRRPSHERLWDVDGGGWSVLGAPLTFVPAAFVLAGVAGIPAAALFDQMAAGVLAGGFWIRLGCVFNGCCVGRETTGRFGVRLHDTNGVIKNRVPVQYLEMAWWAIGFGAYMAIWPTAFAPGSYALGVFAWYGAGRFFLEPLREQPETLLGRVRVNQIVAALMAVMGAGTVLLRAWFR
jgi:prolipoprotein diacylglyceryltransferase